MSGFSGKRLDLFAEIIFAYLQAKTLRISSIARFMSGTYEANYKSITRFLSGFEQGLEIIQRLFLANSPFVICDPTVIQRKEAIKTSYVGFVRPNELGFYLMAFAVPFRGRTIPFYFRTYSSATIASEQSSRNIEHFSGLGAIKNLCRKIPIVFDREFSYKQLLQAFIDEEMTFVVRLNQGNHVKITDSNGVLQELTIEKGGRKVWHNLRYGSDTPVNIGAIWSNKFNRPLFVITNGDPDKAIDLYLQRMKIEMTFRDFKDKMGISKNMSQTHKNMERMMAIALISYFLTILVGEEIRARYLSDVQKAKYSGVFIILCYGSVSIDIDSLFIMDEVWRIMVSEILPSNKV